MSVSLLRPSSEEGCFVYQVVEDPIEVRFKPSTCDASRTGQSYLPGDLIAMDKIEYMRSNNNNNNGPYLRLADGTGWLFERKGKERTMQRMQLHSGLWCFYIGNYPEGQALLRHPTDRSDMCIVENNKLILFDALQKIYCNRRVHNPVTGVCFYRVQGTNGWLADKRPDALREEDCSMLIDENCVKVGLFAYQALEDVGIRNLPQAGDETRTGRSICKGEVCVADAIYKPPHGTTGPFIHLTDGSGWIYEKENNRRVLQPIAVKSGLWTVSVLNPPHGISLYRQPVSNHAIKQQKQDPSTTAMGNPDYWVTLRTELSDMRICVANQPLASQLNDMKYNDVQYEPGTGLHCDLKLTYGGISYYRVKGTKGWIFDRTSSGEKLIQVVSKQSSKQLTQTASASNGWTVDFVRGAAAAIPGMKELVVNLKQQAISFKTGKGVRVHVYYSTRTVGISMDDPVHGKTQLFCRECTDEELGQIFRDPPLDAGAQERYARRRNPEELAEQSIPNGTIEPFMEEEGYRNELLDVEREMERIKEKERELLQKIREYDEKRAKEAETRRRERRQRIDELEKAHKEIDLVVRDKVREIANRQEVERLKQLAEMKQKEKERKKQLELTCLECYQTFETTNHRDEHCKDVHGLCCDHCRKVFRTIQALDEHCIRRGHY